MGRLRAEAVFGHDYQVVQGGIMLVVFGFNVMGDSIRDALDPGLRGVI
jgi:ABC-type dipeptide/oligopeptide/nickel transport system permease component